MDERFRKCLIATAPLGPEASQLTCQEAYMQAAVLFTGDPNQNQEPDPNQKPGQKPDPDQNPEPDQSTDPGRTIATRTSRPSV